MKSSLVSTTIIVTTINLIPFVCSQYVFTYEVPENRAPQSDLFDVSKYKVNSPSQVPQSNGDISKPPSTIVSSNLPYRPPDDEPPASSESPPPQPQLQPQLEPQPQPQSQPSPQYHPQSQAQRPQIQTATRELSPAEEEEARRSLETLQRYINEQSQLGYLRPRFADQGDYRRLNHLNYNPYSGPPPNAPFRGPPPGEYYRGIPPDRPFRGPPFLPHDISRIRPQHVPQPLPQPPPYQPPPQSQPQPYQPPPQSQPGPAQDFQIDLPKYNPTPVEVKVTEERPPQRRPQLSAYNTTSFPQQLPTPPTPSTVPETPQSPPNEFQSPLLNSFLSQYGSYQHQPQPQPQPNLQAQAPPLQEQQPYLYQPSYGTPQVPVHPEAHNNVVLRVIQRRPVNGAPNGEQPYFQQNYPPNQGYPPNVVLRVVQRRPAPQYTHDLGQQTPGPKFQTSQEAIRNLREKQLIQQFARMNTPNSTQYGQPSYNQETSVLPGHRFTRLPQAYRQAYSREDPLVKQAFQERPRQARHNRLEYGQSQRPRYTPTESPPQRPRYTPTPTETPPQNTYTPQYTQTERPPQYYTPQYNQSPRQHYPQDVINRQPSATFETARIPYEPVRFRKEQSHDVPASENNFNKNRFKQQLQKNPNPETFTPSPQLTTSRPRSTSTYKPAHLAVAALPADDDQDGIPGIAGKDYPNLEKIPKTSFSCAKQPIGGYYADTETACQVVHICQAGGLQNSFMCPNGTIFNQEKFACQWWYEANCGTAPSYYSLNDNLYRKTDDRNKKSAK